MTLPNFLGIGAGRSGTTSLHHYLAQHPDVYLSPVKAPSHFFCRDLPRIADRAQRLVVRDYFVPDPGDYEALFDGARGHEAIGEISPVYLATVHAAPRIAAALPEVRLIALLRHPVDRAWARFVGRRRDGLERRADFAEVVRDERRAPLVRDVAFNTYLAAGCCAHVLTTYFDHFPRGRIRIHLFDDFARDPTAVMRDLFRFLDVDPDVAIDTAVRHNRSGGEVRSRALRAVWHRTGLLRAALRPYLPRPLRRAAGSLLLRDSAGPPLDPTLRAELLALYRPEIERLEKVLDRDLSHWLA